MWINRHIEQYVARASKLRPAILITGARQTGKTALLKHLYPNHNFVSLDLPSDAENAENNGDNFLACNQTPLIIDEIQYAPSLFRYLKQVIDQHRNESGLYLLTGSSKFSLMEGISESLAGRIEIIELETLSLQEIQQHRPELKIQDIMVRGGYPELYEKPTLSPNSFYRSYVTTYLERDVRSLLAVSHLRDFERFIRACAHRSGNLLNKAELARDVGISPPTANDWLSVLSASNIIVLLEPWFRNQTRSITKSPKLYFTDTGLLCYLLEISNFSQLSPSPYLGAIWETFVFSELRKQQINKHGSWSLYFWRDRNKEVDFLIHHGGRFELIEAKWSESPDGRATKAIETVSQALGKENIDKKVILCRSKTSFTQKSSGIQITNLLDYAS